MLYYHERSNYTYFLLFIPSDCSLHDKIINMEVKMYVEIPKGSSDKYEYNPITKKLELDRVLSVAMHYPEKYGFIPKTLAPDGDELDVICLTEKASGAGDYIEARI